MNALIVLLVISYALGLVSAVIALDSAYRAHKENNIELARSDARAGFAVLILGIIPIAIFVVIYKFYDLIKIFFTLIHIAFFKKSNLPTAIAQKNS